jgi:energy-coupling factor transporter transmembrane protein EcfT
MGWSLTVAHASGSESSVLFPWLILLLISVKFRVNPWLMFLLGLLLLSVANASASAASYFRVLPWQMLLLILGLLSVAISSTFYASSLKPESI